MVTYLPTGPVNTTCEHVRTVRTDGATCANSHWPSPRKREAVHAATAGLAGAETNSWFQLVVLIATSDAGALVSDVQVSTPAQWCPRQLTSDDDRPTIPVPNGGGYSRHLSMEV